MTLKQSNMIWPLAVLLSGLISCSPEKETVYKPEPAKGGTLTVQNTDESYFKEGNIPRLEVGSSLTLNGYEVNELAHVKVQSRCQRPGSITSVQEEILQTGRVKFLIHDILPKETLLDGSDQTACDFIFTVTKTSGSVRIISLREKSVTGLLSFSNIELPFLKEGVATYASARDLTIETEPVADTIVQCQDFLARSSSSEGMTLGRIIDPALKEGAELSTANQKCRFLSRGAGGTKVSEVMTLQMPFKPLQITTTPVRMNGPDPVMATRNVLRTRIVNSNIFPVVLTLKNHQSDIFVFRPFFAGPGAIHNLLGHEYKRPIIWQVAGSGSHAKMTSQGLEITVKAGEEAVLNGVAALNVNCGPAVGIGGVPIKKDPLMGINFGYQMGSSLTIIPYEGASQTVATTPQFKVIESPSGLPFWDLHIEATQTKLNTKWPGKITDEFLIHKVNWGHLANFICIAG